MCGRVMAGPLESGLRETSPRLVRRRDWRQRSATDDRRQFITLNVRLCVQHDGRDVARDSTAAAEICTCQFNSGSDFTRCARATATRSAVIVANCE